MKEIKYKGKPAKLLRVVKDKVYKRAFTYYLIEVERKKNPQIWLGKKAYEENVEEV